MYEPDVAQRTLGLMIAPDGNVTAEVTKQRDRVRQWAASFAKSDLSNMDKWVGYNSCVKPAVLYPLMGQQITAEAMAEVQRIVNKMVCNAVGVNSHFPRALLHGPIEIGGMGIAPLWVEALVDKVTYFLHHVRGTGTVTQELKASIALVQLEVGSGASFFELHFDIWGALATPCWVSNLWKLCSRVGVQLRAAASAHWIPQLQSTNDRYIMDVVTAESPRKLWGKINYCRRYLQVVTLADLFLHDASRIHPDIRRCRRPVGRLANYMWPDLPPPTKACVDAWKGFLDKCVGKYLDSLSEDDWHDLKLYSHSLPFFYHFGSKMLYRHVVADCWEQFPPLQGTRSLRGIVGKCSLEAVATVPVCPVGSQPVELEQAEDAFVVLAASSRHFASFRFQEQGAAVEDPVLLSERFAALPPLLKSLCGMVDIPLDGGAAIANYARETGRKLYGVSDGSAKAGVGTHGWRLCRFPGDELALQGSGFVEGERTTPFRAESQGQLAILIASTVLAQKWGFTMLEVMSICDNRAVLKRLAKVHRGSRLADHKDPDADLYLVYKDWAREAPVACSYRWVKGHQDRKVPYDELPAEAKINCEVDELAGRVHGRYEGVPREIPTFEQEVYGVYTAAGKLTRGLRRGILAQSGREALEAYYAGKHGLSEGKRDGINWEGLESLLRALKPHLRASFVKYQNGWLPTNAFLQKQGRVASGLCPLCGVVEETSQHVHCCEDLDAGRFRQGKLNACMSELRAAGTAPEIVHCWGGQMSRMFGLPVPKARDLSASRHHEKLEAAVAEARKHQAVLSWEGFLQGRLSVKWNAVQLLHERLRREERRKGLPWSCRSVRLIGTVVLDLWRYRNERVHGATVAEGKQRRRQRVAALVTALYQRNPTLLPRFPSVRAVRLETRLESPVEVLHVWLQQVARQESVTAAVQARTAMQAGSIKRFLVPRSNVPVRGGVEVGALVFDRGKV